jgi:hypothetical protein
MSEPASIHRLKISLRDLMPPVWRRLEVASDVTLADLHELIQTAFMWFDCHLHEFDVGGTTYGIDDGEGSGEPLVGESKVHLGDLVGAGATFNYTYDFGDNWRHLIEVEAVEGPEAGAGYPRCTDGRRSAPPEDVGGPDGYAYFVEAVTDPQHPDHQDQVVWHGRDDFDPDYFEVDDINEALRVT